MTAGCLAASSAHAVLLPINPVLLLLTVKRCSSDPRSQRMVLLLLLCVVAAAPQPYSADELREFIAYARARINPEMRPEAEVRLVESYKELRKQSRADHVSRQVEDRSQVVASSACTAIMPSSAALQKELRNAAELAAG